MFLVNVFKNKINCSYVFDSVNVHIKSKAVPLHAMRRLGERYSSYSFTSSALDGVSGQRNVPTALYPGKGTPGIHCTGGWVGPRAGLDTEARGKSSCL
jgi:hypothetical protein